MAFNFPVWSVLVAALLALGALVYRIWVEPRSLLLIKVPAYVWLLVVYAIETFNPEPGSVLVLGSAARPAFILLLLAIGYVDWRTARDVRRMKLGLPARGARR